LKEAPCAQQEDSEMNASPHPYHLCDVHWTTISCLKRNITSRRTSNPQISGYEHHYILGYDAV
jgi:hypothetical protein